MSAIGISIFVVAFIIIGLPSLLNIFLLFLRPLKGKRKFTVFIIEIICIAFGILATVWALSASNVTDKNWWEQLYNNQKHSPIQPESIPTFIALGTVSLIGYIVLKLVKTSKMPPLCGVFCISAMYLGIAECVVLCIQISKQSDSTVLLYILPINLIIVFIRAIRDVVLDRLDIEKDDVKKKGLIYRIINSVKSWPFLALIFAAPLLGLIIARLFLFGQKPDYIIKMWTETADWTFSDKIPPQNIFYDEHYLCTVAAGGHKSVVKPIRIGIRHGHRVVVNRQLMVANAFEQLLEEHTPGFHRLIRKIYDNTGYPIAKHIKSPFLADLIYLIMKPLEWFFVIILYLFDTKPENRIAVQYPHSKPPVVEEV